MSEKRSSVIVKFDVRPGLEAALMDYLETAIGALNKGDPDENSHVTTQRLVPRDFANYLPRSDVAYR